MRKAWISMTALVAMALVAIGTTSRKDPPSSIWYDGVGFAEPGRDSVEGFTARRGLFMHCGNEQPVVSASGVLVPGQGDPLVLTEHCSWIHRVVAALRPSGSTWGDPEAHHYDLARDRADFLDDAGVTWFRYDRREARTR